MKIRDYAMFQSLIGTIKTLTNTVAFTIHLHVSIPYRDDKNFVCVLYTKISCLVSIPYRDDKNRLKVYKKYFTILLFQSLIGTIKTKGKIAQILNSNKPFQSLIGTIKTCISCLLYTSDAADE